MTIPAAIVHHCAPYLGAVLYDGFWISLALFALGRSTRDESGMGEGGKTEDEARASARRQRVGASRSASSAFPVRSNTRAGCLVPTARATAPDCHPDRADVTISGSTPCHVSLKS